jgi:hypothetical protein
MKPLMADIVDSTMTNLYLENNTGQVVTIIRYVYINRNEIGRRVLFMSLK